MSDLATGNRHQRPRRAFAASLVGLLAIASLAGCVKTDIDLSIKDDTVNGTVVVAFDRRVSRYTGQSEQELRDGLRDSHLPEGEGVTNEPYADGDFVGVLYRLVDAPLATFRPSDSGTSLGISHDIEAGTYRVTGLMDFTDYNKVPVEMRGLLGDFEARVTITFAGDVLEHNGELDGRKVTWRPKAGERLRLEAVARDTERPVWLSVLTIGCPIMLVLGAVVAIVIVVILRRRQRTVPQVPTAGAERP